MGAKTKLALTGLVLATGAGLFWWAMPGAPLGEIVYIGSEGSLCSVPARGGERRCTGNWFSDPAWQPGAAHLAVQAGQHGGPRHLLILKADGGLTKKLSGSTGYMRPEWSADGRFLYALNYDLGPAVGRWNADGNGPVRLPLEGPLPAEVRVQFLAVSPGGTRAILLLNRFDTALLVRLEENRVAVERPILEDFHYIPHAAWPTDTRLLFIAAKNKGDRRALWEADVESGEWRRVGVPGLALGEFLTLSPDGRSVAVNATPAGGPLAWNLWRFDLESKTVTRLTHEGQAWASSWRPLP